MDTEPEIKVMTYKSRQRFFFTLVLVFLIALPALIFYTTGYRLNFDNDETTIVTTGGIYVTTDNLDVDVYLDKDLVERPRLFRSAYYIQNIETGSHRVIVQKPGLHTWVKLLPVDSYIVTEAAAFNMPVLPHIRPIAPFVTTDGRNIFFTGSTSTILFPKATTTTDYVILTARGSTTVIENEEHAFIESLFGTSTAESLSIRDRLEVEINRFQFATTSNPNSATNTEDNVEYLERGDIRIVERGDDLFANWIGSVDNTPHYFCVTYTASGTVSARYGQHVAEQFLEQDISTTTPLLFDKNRICRSEIKLDRKRQDIKTYNFLPGVADLLLLQLEDGLYVTEIDDRAWQNTQLIYPGSDFRTVITDSAIFIMENGTYFELITNPEM